MHRTPLDRSLNRQAYQQLPRRSLKVCATLIQHPANLGGLCRTAEVFRLETLVLADAAIAQTAGFRGLAASSQHWQPLEFCAKNQLPAWLQQQRQIGYTLLALVAEATATCLTNAALPQQAVLLLGQELTGIPIDLVPLCDRVLTIPQSGMTDSLNVQTAAAIAIYEYSKQWPLPG